MNMLPNQILNSLSKEEVQALLDAMKDGLFEGLTVEEAIEDVCDMIKTNYHNN